MAEGFLAVGHDDGNIHPISLTELRRAIDVGHGEPQRETAGKRFNDRLGVVAEMAAWPGIHLNLNGFWHLLLPAAFGKNDWLFERHARSAGGGVPANRTGLRHVHASGTEVARERCRGGPS